MQRVLDTLSEPEPPRPRGPSALFPRRCTRANVQGVQPPGSRYHITPSDIELTSHSIQVQSQPPNDSPCLPSSLVPLPQCSNASPCVWPVLSTRANVQVVQLVVDTVVDDVIEPSITPNDMELTPHLIQVQSPPPHDGGDYQLVTSHCFSAAMPVVRNHCRCTFLLVLCLCVVLLLTSRLISLLSTP